MHFRNPQDTPKAFLPFWMAEHNTKLSQICVNEERKKSYTLNPESCLLVNIVISCFSLYSKFPFVDLWKKAGEIFVGVHHFSISLMKFE